MATVKKPMKACKGVSYPKSSSVSKRIGSPSKAKAGTKVRKYQNAPNPISKTLPGVTVTSKTRLTDAPMKESEKPSVIDRIFGSPEKRAERKETRQGNRDARQTDRAVRRADRATGPRCNSRGCGGRALGFSGYNKNGGATKKAKTGATMTKKCKGGCK